MSQTANVTAPAASAAPTKVSTPNIKQVIGLGFVPSRCDSFVRKFLNNSELTAAMNALQAQITETRKAVAASTDPALTTTLNAQLSQLTTARKAMSGQYFRVNKTSSVSVATFTDYVIRNLINAVFQARDQVQAEVAAKNALARALLEASGQALPAVPAATEPAKFHALHSNELHNDSVRLSNPFVAFASTLPSYSAFKPATRRVRSEEEIARTKASRDASKQVYDNKYKQFIDLGASHEVATAQAKEARAAYHRELDTTPSARFYNQEFARLRATGLDAAASAALAKNAKAAFVKNMRIEATKQRAAERKAAIAGGTYVAPVRESVNFRACVREVLASVYAARGIAEPKTSAEFVDHLNAIAVDVIQRITEMSLRSAQSGKKRTLTEAHFADSFNNLLLIAGATQAQCDELRALLACKMALYEAETASRKAKSAAGAGERFAALPAEEQAKITQKRAAAAALAEERKIASARKQLERAQKRAAELTAKLSGVPVKA